MRPAWLWLLGLPLTTLAGEPGPLPPPSDDQCLALPEPRTPRSLRVGEELEFTLDALGARAGRMSMRVLRPTQGVVPVEVQAETNSFFSKIRKVHGQATSFLHPGLLRPVRYSEDSDENNVHRTAEVSFDGDTHSIAVQFTIREQPGEAHYRYAHEGLDSISALYALRELPFRSGLPLCMDVYGVRRLWRLSGHIVAREHLSLELGEFEAWHIAGEAIRLDDASQRREVHVWISDDARRLPLVAVGAFDVGMVRATLNAFRRPGEKAQRAQPKSDLKW